MFLLSLECLGGVLSTNVKMGKDSNLAGSQRWAPFTGKTRAAVLMLLRMVSFICYIHTCLKHSTSQLLMSQQVLYVCGFPLRKTVRRCESFYLDVCIALDHSSEAGCKISRICMSKKGTSYWAEGIVSVSCGGWQRTFTPQHSSHFGASSVFSVLFVSQHRAYSRQTQEDIRLSEPVPTLCPVLRKTQSG